MVGAVREDQRIDAECYDSRPARNVRAATVPRRRVPPAPWAWMLNKPHVWAACLLAYCFFPLLWIAQYNYPSGDDYVQYSQAHSLGTLAAVRWWYRNWTGRYASFFIQSSFPNYD